MGRSPMFGSEWTRRSLLKTSLVGMYLLGCRVLWPERQWVAACHRARSLLRRTDRRTRHRNIRDESGRYDESALNDLNYILRCHHSGQSIRMDIRVIEIVNAVQKQLRRNPAIHIVSGIDHLNTTITS